MNWNVFQILFEAKSPLHIGGKRVGMIQRTRYYIPAMTFWGALTARLTRQLYPHPRREDYKAVGFFCHAHLRTSYFFPGIDSRSGQPLDNLLMPEYHRDENQWAYGGYSSAEFERIFLSAYGSTAIVNRRTAAEDASLHEIQLLLEKVRLDGVKRVYFGGYLFAKATDSESETLRLQVDGGETLTVSSPQQEVELKNVLSSIQIGGERAYGYGRLKLIDLHRLKETRLWGGSWEIRAQPNSPHLFNCKAESKKVLPAHLCVEGLSRTDWRVHGGLEALVSRRWEEKGIGESIKDLGACFVPGSVVQDPVTLSIEPYGILKAIN